MIGPGKTGRLIPSGESVHLLDVFADLAARYDLAK